MANTKTRVAVVQLAFHPAALVHRRSPIEDPLFKSGVASALQPRPGAIPAALKDRQRTVCERVRAVYCEQLWLRLRAIVRACADWQVRVLVLPEYSVPHSLLDQLANEPGARAMVIVAGTHTVPAPRLQDGVYQRLHTPDEFLPEPGMAVCPVLFAGRIIGLQPKLKPAKPEQGSLNRGRSWHALDLSAHDPTLPGPMGVMICLDFLHRDHEQYRQLVGPGLDTCRFLAVPSLTPYYSLDEFAATSWREALRYKRPVLYCDIANGGGTSIYVDATGRKRDLQPFPDTVGYLERGDEGVIVADIDFGLRAPGKATAYEYDDIVRPVAAASLVYRCVPAMAEYADWLAALAPAMVGGTAALGTVAAEVAGAGELFDRVGRVRGGDIRTQRLARLRGELDHITDMEDIRRFTREVIVPDTALPLPWLRAAMADGAADEVDRWFVEHRGQTLLDMWKRLDGGAREIRAKGGDLTDGGRVTVDEIRARVGDRPAPAPDPVDSAPDPVDPAPDAQADTVSDAQADTDAAPVEAPPVAPLPVPERLRVLVLATERDLGRARARVIEHLRVALGVLAEGGDASSQADPGDYDHVVLVQGWWWDGGQAAAIWQRAPVDQRTLFVIDEDAAWPPRKLSERGADGDVEAFRTSQPDCELFQDPGQLPGLISERISRVQNERAVDSQDMGLREWERRYLEKRLPAWRDGRTTAGRSHLIEAKERTELYRAEMYVPLDGHCDGWRLDPDGVLHEASADDLADDLAHGLAHGLASGDLQRVSLERWLSAPNIPRLTIIGAPGGGKTVFLTRMASWLATVHLGRASNFGAFDLDALRGPAGRLPVPLLMDAPRIADHLHADETEPIVRAALHEAGAGDDDDAAAQLRTGLQRGRYVVLIDALDEVADTRKRLALIDALKGMAAHMPATRAVLTTRSARYTGALSFGPEFEVVELAPLSATQIEDFCRRWATVRARDELYLQDLVAAVTGLDAHIDTTGDEQGIASNPLMLTAVCLVFERHRSLPDERAQLCSLLVDDLLRSRTSKDPERDWWLSDTDKRDLLERMALGMQRDGAQSWRLTLAQDVALQGISAQDVERQARAVRHVQWTAEHTGLLRFEQPERGPEQLRFWHRLFREYLAACRLSRLNMSVEDLVDDMWQRGHLVEPFWEDVIRLLPGVFGERDRANAMIARLQALAGEESAARGRLHGLAAAAIIESRGLFPGIDAAVMARNLAELYTAEGNNWSPADQFLVLNCLGRLDPVTGDPRLHEELWLVVESDGDASFSIGWAPITVQEYRTFVQSDDVLDERWWPDVESSSRATIADIDPALWQAQLRNLNYPVTGVSFVETQAYCRWRTARRTDHQVVRIPSADEARRAQRAGVVLNCDTQSPVSTLFQSDGVSFCSWSQRGAVFDPQSRTGHLGVLPEMYRLGARRIHNVGIRCILASPEPAAAPTDESTTAPDDSQSARTHIVIIHAWGLDERLTVRLRRHLAHYERQGLVDPWPIWRIREQPADELTAALARARLAVVFLSVNLLSEVVVDYQNLWAQLADHQEAGATVRLALATPCGHEQHPGLQAFQLMNTHPLSRRKGAKRDELCQRIVAELR